MNMKKTLKKIITVTICIIMMSQGIYANDVDLITLSPETENSIREEDICNMVKEEINISDDYKLNYFDLITNDTYFHKNVWKLTFYCEDKSIEVIADAETGRVIRFEKFGESESKVVKITREQVRKISQQYIDDNYPDLKNQLTEINISNILRKVDIDCDRENYSVMYARKINNEILISNYISVIISGITGEIIMFEKYWDDYNYTKDNKEISQEEVLETFKKTNSIETEYIEVNDTEKEEDNKVTLKPVYYYNMNSTNFIDAVSKEFYYLGDLYSEFYELIYEDDEEYIAFGGVIDEEEILPEKGTISKEKVEQIILDKIKYLTNIKSLNIDSINYNDKYNGIKGKYWVISAKDDKLYVNATVDAVTGEVSNIHYIASDELDSSNTDNDIDITNIKKQAQNIISKMFPKITDKDYIIETKESFESNKIHFNCTRVIKDRMYGKNGFILVYDIGKNAFTIFDFDWFQIDIIDLQNKITKEEASDIFYKEVGFSKELVQLLDTEKENTGVPSKDLKLVYRLNPYEFSYIDMENGKLLDEDGKEYKNTHEIENFTDIKGNENELTIKLMNKMGFIKETNEKFSPDAILTKKDAIKWTVLTIGSQCERLPNANHNNINNNEIDFINMDENDDYYTYMVDAVKMNIIENTKRLNKDQEVTLMDMIKLIINGMGGKKLATSTALFADEEGIKEINKGYVALAKYYKIINNETNLSENLTRGQAIKLIYDFIKIIDNNSYCTYLKL
ncbi:YcdB/YcdC domain-containing protein [Vallitalea longa]|nr:YcdB/YcdC domain-containing protein [Vallitalea longa]